MIVTRKLNSSEPDLLLNNENLELTIHDLDKVLITSISAPEGGWTHDKLEAIDYQTIAPFGWEAYLGNTECWIGGSEV
jgi:hypothetical protein